MNLADACNLIPVASVRRRVVRVLRTASAVLHGLDSSWRPWLASEKRGLHEQHTWW
jgi:hypothetical protein